MHVKLVNIPHKAEVCIIFIGEQLVFIVEEHIGSTGARLSVDFFLGILIQALGYHYLPARTLTCSCIQDQFSCHVCQLPFCHCVTKYPRKQNYKEEKFLVSSGFQRFQSMVPSLWTYNKLQLMVKDTRHGDYLTMMEKPGRRKKGLGSSISFKDTLLMTFCSLKIVY